MRTKPEPITSMFVRYRHDVFNGVVRHSRDGTRDPKVPKADGAADIAEQVRPL